MIIDKKTSYNRFLFVCAAVLILLTGCQKYGTAVVLWPPEDSPRQPGELLKVKDESILRTTYIYNIPGQRRLKEEMDQWRLKLFGSSKNAEAWAEALGEWRDVYAECTYQGLPMRADASNTSERIYRFREGELIKVIGRNPGPVQVGNLEGFWYHVIADGGVEGYVFDYYLKVIRIQSGQTEVLNARDEADPVLASFLSGVWRPESFSQMIRNRRINLEEFRSEYGLFPDPDQQIMTLRLPGRNIVETWTGIIPAGGTRYDFTGTSFRVTVNSENYISVQYNDGSSEHFEAFILMEENIEQIIRSERSRRTAVLKNLLETGPVYESQAYGKLSMDKDGRFRWTGKSSLIARGIISASAGNTGSIEFDHFLSSALRGTYAGVMSLSFDNGETIRFLYAFENGGMRMLYVPEHTISDNRVLTDQFINPVRLFFTPGKADSAEP